MRPLCSGGVLSSASPVGALGFDQETLSWAPEGSLMWGIVTPSLPACGSGQQKLLPTGEPAFIPGSHRTAQVLVPGRQLPRACCPDRRPHLCSALHLRGLC